MNEYAEKLVALNTPAKRYSIYQNFKPIDIGEYYRFMAILIAMGLDPRPRVKDFWADKIPHMHTPWYNQTMSRNRFEMLYHTFLHAAGRDAEVREKVEPFINKVMNNSQDAFYPGKDMSIDEMVVGFRGRWKYLQFNATKPSKYHIKTFGLCDSDTGYVYNLFTYYGSETGYHPDIDPDSTNAVKVFKTLCEPLEKGHHIYADRFYTSVPLLQFLQTQSLDYTGTVDVRRKDFPRQLKTLKLSKKESKWFATADGEFMLVAFRDKKAKKFVAVVTTAHAGKVGTVPKKTRGGEIVDKPLCIDDYNQKMNGCDRVDQLVQYYGIHKRKSYKWWKKVFHFLLEIIHVNARILYSHVHATRSDAGELIPLVIRLRDFKLLLIEQLMQSAALVENVPPALPEAADVVTDNPAVRLSAKSHFAKSLYRKDRACHVCSQPGKRKRTTYVCATCPGEPHLCFPDCFNRWHVKLKYKYTLAVE